MSAHFIDINDKNGDVIDRVYYCSDSCAQEHPDYNGWNGLLDLYSPEACDNCGKTMVWYDEEEQTWKCGALTIKGKHDGYWSLFGTYNCYECGALCDDTEDEE